MNGYWMTATIAALALACLVVIAILLPGVANAQQTACGDRKEIIDHIFKKYKEERRAIAITGGNNFMEILRSPAGTWTMLITPANGQTCIIATGEGWEDVAIKPAGTAL